MKRLSRAFFINVFKDVDSVDIKLDNGSYIVMTKNDIKASYDPRIGIGSTLTGKEVEFNFMNVVQVIYPDGSKLSLDDLNAPAADNGEVYPGYEKPSDSEDDTDPTLENATWVEVVDPKELYFGTRGILKERIGQFVYIERIDNSIICTSIKSIARR